jgi:hypothetical protein
VYAELTMTGTDGAYTGKIVSVAATVETPTLFTPGSSGTPVSGWFSMLISGTTVTCYWNGAQVGTATVAAHSGLRVGFGMTCTVDGGICLVDVFRAQYYSTGDVTGSRPVLVGSAGGGIYMESFLGTMSAVSVASTLNDVSLASAQAGQMLYIADFGDVRATGTDGAVAGTSFDAASYSDWSTLGILKADDVIVISNGTGTVVDGTYKIDTVAAGNLTLASAAGTGTCAYRIERAPKVFDPSAETLGILTATAGQVPTGNPIVARYLDRIVLAGADIAPHVWYMSRQGTHTDWDYSQTDAQRAVAGTSSDAGVPGEPLTAVIPHSDDYCIFACANSMWRLRGDPAVGGVFDALSRTVGIVSRDAWCLGPSGELVFLSRAGLYILAPGGSSVPQPLSREILPRELMNIEPSTTTVAMAFDAKDNGVHVFLTPESSNSRIHWWVDWSRKTFWPMSYDSTHEATAVCDVRSTSIEESGVILGCRDGYLRRFHAMAPTDCGTAFDSSVVLGPIGIGRDFFAGILREFIGVLARDSGDVDWTIAASNSFEGALSEVAEHSGTWSAGVNAVIRSCGRGQAVVITLTGGGDRWAVESIYAIVEPIAGRVGV